METLEGSPSLLDNFPSTFAKHSGSCLNLAGIYLKSLPWVFNLHTECLFITCSKSLTDRVTKRIRKTAKFKYDPRWHQATKAAPAVSVPESATTRSACFAIIIHSSNHTFLKSLAMLFPLPSSFHFLNWCLCNSYTTSNCILSCQFILIKRQIW